jgi:hypothetical protein
MTIRLSLLAGTIAMGTAILTGCGSGGDTADQPAESTSASAPAPAATTAAADGSDYAGPTIPPGFYTRHLTPEEARTSAEGLGLTPDAIDEAVGSAADDLAFSFKVGDGVWAQYAAVDGGEPQVGDSGTFSYDADGNWSTVSNSTGCPGCVLVYRWSVQAGRLTLEVIPGYDEDPLATFVTQGTYQLDS